MRNGDRNNVITIEVETDGAKDALRQPVKAWGPWKTNLFCGIIPVRGGENFNAGDKQRVSTAMFRFKCNFYDVVGATDKMRIDFEGQKYNIIAIKPDYQGREDCIFEAELQDGNV